MDLSAGISMPSRPRAIIMASETRMMLSIFLTPSAVSILDTIVAFGPTIFPERFTSPEVWTNEMAKTVTPCARPNLTSRISFAVKARNWKASCSEGSRPLRE